MSLSRRIMASADICSERTKCFCRGASEVDISSSDMPITPFIGVLISWLMFARNCDLAMLAASAAARALSISWRPLARCAIACCKSSFCCFQSARSWLS